MTRINADLNPRSLLDQHLFAEYREILMVPPALRRSLNAKSMNQVLREIPPKYLLNSGHVKYFYDKLGFLAERRSRLLEELKFRNYAISNLTELDVSGIPYEFIGDWKMDRDARDIITDRIMERYDKQPTWYKYFGKPIERPVYLEILKHMNGE